MSKCDTVIGASMNNKNNLQGKLRCDSWPWWFIVLWPCLNKLRFTPRPSWTRSKSWILYHNIQLLSFLPSLFTLGESVFCFALTFKVFGRFLWWCGRTWMVGDAPWVMLVAIHLQLMEYTRCLSKILNVITQPTGNISYSTVVLPVFIHKNWVIHIILAAHYEGFLFWI
jgi:hypothetical protein